MKALCAATLGIFLFALTAEAAGFNAGFVQGIWFEDEKVFAGEPIRIYVALRNNTGHDLTGTVRFTDNGNRVGSSYVSALPGRLVEAWTDWTPSYGEHTVKATLSNTQIHPLGESSELIEVVSAEAEIDIFVDRDTDKDDTGDKEDADDDNDTVSDEDEMSRGTDPLVFNESERKTENEKNPSENDNNKNEQEESGDGEEQAAAVHIAPSREGFEKYVENEAVDKLLSNVTNKVTGVKQSLDSYRISRKTEGGMENLKISTSTGGETLSLPDTPGVATITRTQMERSPGVIKTMIAALLAFFSTMYTFVLWLLSGILAHPALVQLTLLFLILFTLYLFARRFGKRPKSYD